MYKNNHTTSASTFYSPNQILNIFEKKCNITAHIWLFSLTNQLINMHFFMMLPCLSIHDGTVTVLHRRKNVGVYIEKVTIWMKGQGHQGAYALMVKAVEGSSCGKFVRTHHRTAAFLHTIIYFVQPVDT